MPKEFSHESIQELMRFRPSLTDTAKWFQVSEDTIERRIQDWAGVTFREFKIIHTASVRHKLIDRAIEMAMNGNTTMMIFCLKNYCGWKDSGNESEGPNSNIVVRLAFDPSSV